MKPKRVHVVFFVLLLTLALVVFPVFRFWAIRASIVRRPWIASYRGFNQITRGMTQAEVIRLLGNPTRHVIKGNVNEYRFGQGPEEAQIKEGWIYSPAGYNGHIEIYFGVNQKVVGKTCGNG